MLKVCCPSRLRQEGSTAAARPAIKEGQQAGAGSWGSHASRPQRPHRHFTRCSQLPPAAVHIYRDP